MDDDATEAEIRTRLRFLRIRERTVNIEDREAVTRRIKELESRLDDGQPS
ncbi:hypothetical protein [Halosegnis marinus]|uniref:Uncharacterized protein n=1 Tax=Halosegnis marinus TaxID=3034023 RepID=A0ABD5ZN95_9EURY|nr:hypothetical protein [Halosegnis sp. DT85]